MSTTAEKGLGRDIIVGVFAVLTVNLVIYLLIGFRQGGDAPRYLGGAQRLLAGQGLSIREQAYFGYIFLVAGIRWLGLPAATMYGVHIVAACLAGVALARLGRLYRGDITGIMTALLWAFFYEIQKWNFYLITDGFFISIVAVTCWAVVRAAGRGDRQLVLALALVLFMASLRFNGFLFAVICLVYLLVRAAETRCRLLVGAAILLLVVLPSAADFSAVHWWRASEEGIAREGTFGFMTQGQVIWETVRIDMPVPGPASGHTLADFLGYVARHPFDVGRLLLYRLVHYLFAYNPHFSRAHTAANLLQWLAIYAFGVGGVIQTYRRKGLALAWLPALWLCQCLLVVLTVGDYDGRYSIYAAPALLPFVAVGLTVAWERLAARVTATHARREAAW